MKRIFQNCRTEFSPTSWKTADDITTTFAQNDIFQMCGMAKYREFPKPFFKTVHEEFSFEYCIFSSNRSIELMEDNIDADQKKLYIDGTFKVCPKCAVKQLLIIYVEYYRHVIYYAVESNLH